MHEIMFEIKQVYKSLRTLITNKSGLEGFPPTVLKICALEIATILVVIFLKFPTSSYWKAARVKPKGDLKP